MYSLPSLYPHRLYKHAVLSLILNSFSREINKEFFTVCCVHHHQHDQHYIHVEEEDTYLQKWHGSERNSCSFSGQSSGTMNFSIFSYSVFFTEWNKQDAMCLWHAIVFLADDWQRENQFWRLSVSKCCKISQIPHTCQWGQ